MVLSMDRWIGKIAIVTGASTGIGAATAEQLVEIGVNVVGIARRVQAIEEHSKKLSNKKGKLYAFKADITEEEEILKAFQWVKTNFGAVHILINNAGFLKESLLTEGKTEDWKRILDINVLALSIATREAIKSMRDNNINGHIIHINSINGHKVPPAPGVNMYPASKHAVTALTETLRQELNSLGSKIKISSVSPGLVRTEMTVLNKDISDERREYLKTRPVLEPEDIADGVVYVLSTPDHVQVHELTIKPVGEPY